MGNLYLQRQMAVSIVLQWVQLLRLEPANKR
jgi:hypothetical protein